MNSHDCAALVEVTRGEIVESIHFGAFVVVSSEGDVIASEGNSELVTFPRSSMKPFQALPLVESGGADALGLNEEEIAIQCASHTGTDAHTTVIKRLHHKAGLQEDDLACGVHWPVDEPTRSTMKKAGLKPTPFRHNCSGKHSGMLAQAVYSGEEKLDYLNPQHPVQLRIRQVFAEMVELQPDEMGAGVDGCSAPVYNLPMVNMARAVASLADPKALAPKRADACRRITAAMMHHPVMVSGPDTFDTDLMEAAQGKVFSKGGAEGYQIVGVMPGAAGTESPGLGMAIKISDGDPRGRARSAVSLAILAALNILSGKELQLLAKYGSIPVRNWRDIVVGEIRPAFEIKV